MVIAFLWSRGRAFSFAAVFSGSVIIYDIWKTEMNCAAHQESLP
jgi:hypothetical protein